MEADKGKILQTANQLAARGQFDKAIAEWKKLLVDSPHDGSIQNNIGDLHLKRHATDEAIEAYLQAGAAFHAAGSALKAIAVYKKILKLDPARYGVYQQLGDLNAERGLVNNAVSDYLTLSKLLLRDGRTRDALAVYRKIVDLDPVNLSARQRLAELCLQENQRDEAIKAFFQLAKEAVAQDQLDHARKSCEAILKLDPNNAKAAKLLKDPKAAVQEAIGPAAGREPLPGGPLEQAQQQIDRGQYEQAEILLSDLLSAQPGDPEVCRLLAMLHLKRGELAIALSEIQFLAEAAIRAEDYGLAESMINEYLKADSSCVALLELLGSSYEHKGDPAGAALQYGQAALVLITKPDPEAPTRHTELYQKVKALDSASPILAQLTSALAEASKASQGEPKTDGATKGVEVEPAPAGAAAVPPTQMERPVTAQPVSMPMLKLVADEQQAAVQREETELDPASVGPAGVLPSAVSPTSKPVPTSVAGSSDLLREAVPDSAPVSESIGASVASGVPEPVRAEPRIPELGSAEPSPQPIPVKQPTEYDHHVRYELGMAYKNMGMLAEAVEEFRLAIHGKDCFLDATTMLAASLKEQGLLEPAIECLEQALSDPRCDKEKAIPVRYELGLLYEVDGSVDKAVHVFLEIPTFLDVPVRLERLRGTGKSEHHDGEPPAEPTTAAAGTTTGAERKKRRISYL